MEKLRLLFLILLLPFFGQVSFADSRPKLDSLWQIWEDDAQLDSVRLKAINKFIWKGLLFSQPDSALRLAQLQYDFAKNANIESAMAAAINNQGIAYSIKGENEESIYYFNKGLELATKLGNSKSIARLLNNLGGLHRKQGDLPTSIDYFNQCLKLYRKLEDKPGQALCISNIGDIYSIQEYYDKSLECYIESLQLLNKHEDQEEVATVYSKIGNLYTHQNLWDKALEHLNMAYEIRLRSDNQYEYADLLSRIGVVYYGKKEYQKALNYQFKSMKIQKELDFHEDLAFTQLEIGRLYLQFNKLDSAIFYTEKAFDDSKIRKSTELTVESSELLYQCFKASGDKSRALEMLEIYLDAKVKTDNDKNEKAILQFKYQSEYEKLALAEKMKNEKLQREREFNIQQERFLLGGIALVITIVIGVILRVRYLTNVNERKELVYQIEILKERGVSNFVATNQERTEMALNRSKLDAAIDGSLNASDWKILNVLFKEPLITNKEIANQVSLSLEGTSSALRKMYKMFNISPTKNKKLALITEATRISSKQP